MEACNTSPSQRAAPLLLRIKRKYDDVPAEEICAWIFGHFLEAGIALGAVRLLPSRVVNVQRLDQVL